MEFKFVISSRKNIQGYNRLEVQTTVQIEPKIILMNQSTNGGWGKKSIL